MSGKIKSALTDNRWSGDLLALLSGASFPFAFAPFDYWPVGIISISTFLLSLASAGNRRGVWRFYLFAVAMYGVGASWIYVSIHRYGGASPMLATVLVAGFVLCISLISVLHGLLYMKYVRVLPLGLALGFPVMWVIQEWFRTWFLTGFPWLFAGYGHLHTPLAGWAPVLGVLGVSLAVVMTGTLLYLMVRERRRQPILAGIAVLVVIWGGGFALKQVEFVEPTGEAVSVSAVQGNINQAIKWQRRMVQPILNRYRDLTSEEWGRDLIVWPEAAVTLFRENAGYFLRQFEATGRENDSTLVFGIPDRAESGGYLNSAIAVGDGDGIYHKRRLVPFGEYVPLEQLLRGIIGFFDLPMSHNESGADEQAPLRAGTLRLSLSICYEVVYPELVRSTVKDPDLLITISNDTWFGQSIGPEQHFQMARMRALENGRYMVRATNNGITAIVDERGRVKDVLPRFEQGVLRGKAQLMAGRTPWHLWGNWPVLMMTFGSLAAMWMLWFRRFR